jgi:putative glycosyltransferase (TIGR04348 family)
MLSIVADGVDGVLPSTENSATERRTGLPAQIITLVSPAQAGANNGNWQTASRWARFLRSAYTVGIVPQWTGAMPDPALLIALHARRSAASLAAYAARHPTRPRVLVLTGTDLYRDIATDASAQASLDIATRLVVLQPMALDALPPELRAKAMVVYQSAPALKPVPGVRRTPEICMIGHLRAEKDPATFMRAATLVTAANVRLTHIGDALEPGLGELAQATQAATPRYRWLGKLPHGEARQRLKRCHAMVISSTMEGGANVIIEAVTSGVPVIASDIAGNRGMLGDDYAGYFAVGDARALARLIERSVADPDFYAQLKAQCAARALLFTPAAERAAVLDLVDNLIHS